MAFLDPPYNVRVNDVVGRGSIKQAEFAMASGEMSPADYTKFLEKSFDVAAAMSLESAVHFVCMDWRHIPELFEAARAIYHEILTLAVRVKDNGGLGGLYRNQHELIAVCHVGEAPYLNNVQLGRHGRIAPTFGTIAAIAVLVRTGLPI